MVKATSIGPRTTPTEPKCHDLQTIPGIGPSISKNLKALGYANVEDLRGADPESMYDELCRIRRERVDRCVLYVFRCAVYYAETDDPDPELLKWWSWKDG